MLERILKFVLVFVLIFAWVSGYPPVYENLWRARIWLPEKDMSGVLRFKQTRTINIAEAATVGPNLPQNCPTNCESVSGIGTVAWTNPGNVSASDDTNRASATLGKDAQSYWLKATNFGFSLPSNAIIQGITVEWETSENGDSGNAGIIDGAIRIVKGGTIGATDKSRANTIFWPATASEVFVSYGGISDLWGETWGYTDINATNFGAALSGLNKKVSGGGGQETALVDAVRITITYDTPNFEQYNWRWRNDNAGEGGSANLYFNPTGNGFGAVDFTIVASACAVGSEWDCVDDGSTDTQATAPTSDLETSELKLANAKDYYTLADNAIAAGATITQLDITVSGADDIGNPNTSITLGYCIVGGANDCGTNDTMGSAQNITAVDQTKTEQFTGLNLSTTDLNNMQLVVQGSGVNATFSTLYVLVTYDTSAATYKAAENTAVTGQNKNENVRLRFTVDNNGVSAASNFRLQVSPMVGTCDNAGAGESYVNVPTTSAGCGSAVACLTTTANFGNQADTVDLADANGLTDPAGSSFITGRLVEDPGNASESQTVSITLAQNQFTEVEYNFQFTNNAANSTDYCFWTTRSGTALTTYTGASASNAVAQIQTAGAGASLTFVVSTDNFPAGGLTPGSPVFATSTLSVDTNNSSGWYVTLSGNNKTTSANVLNDGGSNEIPDPTNEWSVPSTQATTTGGNASTISFGDDFLYFRVMTASGSPAFISTGWWGGGDEPYGVAGWAGIASSTNVSRIGDSSVDSGASPDLNTVLFYLDVPDTQPTGTYTGTITFTATMNP